MSSIQSNFFSSDLIQETSIAFVNDDTNYELPIDIRMKWCLLMFASDERAANVPANATEEIRAYYSDGIIEQDLGILSCVTFDGAGMRRIPFTLFIPLSSSIQTPPIHRLRFRSINGDGLAAFSISITYAI